jgi:hypothetical protein
MFGFMGFSIRVKEWRCESIETCIVAALVHAHNPSLASQTVCSNLALYLQTPSGGNGMARSCKHFGMRLDW